MANSPEITSMPDQLTSWPNLSTICKRLHISVDNARPILQAHGILAGPTDRLPFEVAARILNEHGYKREQQFPV